MSNLDDVDETVRLLDELAHDGTPRSRDQWLHLARGCQQLVNRLTAVQDGAIAHACSIECVYLQDGTLGEVDRGPGRVALDAADVLAPTIGASHHQAQRRVEQAVRVAGGREPVPAGPGPRGRATGLGGLHQAMREGRLDSYRAGVVAFELEGCPAEVAQTVVAALDPHLAAEPAPGLRRRTRRLLARVSPDLLRQRVERSRRETGLQRWAGEPGVDVWHGTFPTEDSARAWAAIDDLARRYVREGSCPDLERARAKALTDLVLEHSDVRVQVVLAVPAGQQDGAPDPPTPQRGAASPGDGAHDRARPRPGGADADHDDLVQVHGARPSEPQLVSRTWLAAHTDPATEEVACDPTTGARVDPDGALTTDAYRPPDRLTALVRARDGRCRFPGCSVAARYCDLDHARPWPHGPTAATNLLCLCRRHHRVKQSPGWRLRLHPDGTAHWTDPDGQVRTTHPLDALDALTLPAPPDDGPPYPPGRRVPSRREEHHTLLLQQREIWQRRTIHHTWSDLTTTERRRNRLAQFEGPPPY